jgi:hypothetical protein
MARTTLGNLKKIPAKSLYLGIALPTALTPLPPLPLSAVLTVAALDVLTGVLIPQEASAQVVSSGGGSTTTGGTTTTTGGTTTTTGGTTTTTGGTTTTSGGGTTLLAPGTATQGSQVNSGASYGTVFITRTFTETLGDRNQQTVTGDGSVQLPGLPANASGYAEPSAFQAKFPINVKDVPAPAPAYRVFATGFGGGFNESGGQNGSFYGGLAGIDYQVLPNLIVGAAAGGSESRLSIASANASGTTSGVNGSIYAIATAGPFYAQTLTTFSSFSNHTSRNVAAADGFAAALEAASFGSSEIRERAEFGRVLTSKDLPWLDAVKITPFVALEIANLHLNGHSEINVNGVGNFAGLTTAGQDIADVPGFVGARIERSFDVGNGMVLTPILRAAYVHQFATQSVTQAVLVSTGASVFTSNGTLLGRDAAQVKAGAELSISRNTVLFANFEGLFSGNSDLYGGRGGIRVTW